MDWYLESRDLKDAVEGSRRLKIPDPPFPGFVLEPSHTDDNETLRSLLEDFGVSGSERPTGFP